VIGRVGQGVELTPDLIPPSIQVSRDQSGLLCIRHLDDRERFDAPPIVLKLTATRCA
jgi:fibronectin type 3 domain-containing protein